MHHRNAIVNCLNHHVQIQVCSKLNCSVHKIQVCLFQRLKIDFHGENLVKQRMEIQLYTGIT
jgi:hypothetical protein